MHGPRRPSEVSVNEEETPAGADHRPARGRSLLAQLHPGHTPEDIAKGLRAEEDVNEIARCCADLSAAGFNERISVNRRVEDDTWRLDPLALPPKHDGPVVKRTAVGAADEVANGLACGNPADIAGNDAAQKERSLQFAAD